MKTRIPFGYFLLNINNNPSNKESLTLYETTREVVAMTFLCARLLLQLMPHQDEWNGKCGSDVKRKSNHQLKRVVNAERQSATGNTFHLDVDVSSGDGRH